MDLSVDPGSEDLARLQATFKQRPFLLECLKIKQPVNLNLDTLFEVLDFYKNDKITEDEII